MGGGGSMSRVYFKNALVFRVTSITSVSLTMSLVRQFAMLYFTELCVSALLLIIHG